MNCWPNSPWLIAVLLTVLALTVAIILPLVRRGRALVTDFGAKTLRSWDYQNCGIDIVTSTMFVATNILGLVTALATRGTSWGSLEAVFITFSYYSTATRVMWEFNRIYRNLESALTDAAQFADLLLDPPVVTDAEQPEAPARRSGWSAAPAAARPH